MFSRKPDTFEAISAPKRAQRDTRRPDAAHYDNRTFVLPCSRTIGPPRPGAMTTSRDHF
jgi:hypothetical protein